jgi:hypothetical protein
MPFQQVNVCVMLGYHEYLVVDAGGQPRQKKLARPFLKKQAGHSGTCL